MTGKLTVGCSTGTVLVTPYISIFRDGSRVVDSKSPGLRQLGPGDAVNYTVHTADAAGTQCYKARLFVLVVTPLGEVDGSVTMDTVCVNT
ncbi:hypothetical protein Misp01_79090 [Microtetraspora sp. NBRC 13810]|nr:hypothetical protein Misp01_79090 [Microtetraspora sp. NBRC 13810]